MGFETSLKKVIKKVSQIPGIAVSVTYRKVSTGTYSVSRGEVSETFVDTSIKGIFKDVNQREVTDLVQADDRKLTIAAGFLSSAPTTAARIIYNSVQYQIIRANIKYFMLNFFIFA